MGGGAGDLLPLTRGEFWAEGDGACRARLAVFGAGKHLLAAVHLDGLAYLSGWAEKGAGGVAGIWQWGPQRRNRFPICPRAGERRRWKGQLRGWGTGLEEGGGAWGYKVPPWAPRAPLRGRALGEQALAGRWVRPLGPPFARRLFPPQRERPKFVREFVGNPLQLPRNFYIIEMYSSCKKNVNSKKSPADLAGRGTSLKLW